jgi:FAD-linked sulfhydryl oxidase
MVALDAGCEQTACRSKADMFRAMGRMAGASEAASAPAAPQSECPPFREELGRCSWTLARHAGLRLASVSANSACSSTRSRRTTRSVRAPTSRRTPPTSSAPWLRCIPARTAAQTSTQRSRATRRGTPLASSPSSSSHLSGRVESREALAVWLCGQHNLVNAKLSKPTFPCNLAALDRRWRTGGPECSAEEGTSAESLGQDSA